MLNKNEIEVLKKLINNKQNVLSLGTKKELESILEVEEKINQDLERVIIDENALAAKSDNPFPVDVWGC